MLKLNIISNQVIISRTQKWLKTVVIGCHFCPFAAPVFQADNIHYDIVANGTVRHYLDTLLRNLRHLDTHPEAETTLIIFPESLGMFQEYLNFVKRAESFLISKGYEGKYQLASFHPDYVFANASQDDAANYTNRSIYPMLHILREKGISKALHSFPQPENIPERNMAYARKKGLEYMKQLREDCFDINETS
ncbi:DUF1415 domain-containing protein [Taibaiella lutea]|uniref:DUF1415 domain-containing protein n=1 Tax=Taibaiella lutea TaxID=2608001 RepID=UPI001C1207AB|nr:DUF1415 domain-containing protein [Taibaiella lutea]